MTPKWIEDIESKFNEAHPASWDDIHKLISTVMVLREALNELTTMCTHDEEDLNYRPLGDTYGWCSVCQTKVSYRENIGRDALRHVDD
jgi:hypothetical protein